MEKSFSSTTLDAAYRILTETQQRMNAGREASERRGAGITTSSIFFLISVVNFH